MELFSEIDKLACLLSEFFLVDLDGVVLENILGVLFQDGEIISANIVFPDHVELVPDLSSLRTLV